MKYTLNKTSRGTCILQKLCKYKEIRTILLIFYIILYFAVQYRVYVFKNGQLSNSQVVKQNYLFIFIGSTLYVFFIKKT